MADYYPLLAKAVSGMKTSTPDSRHAIYERARQALLGQLRAMQPPAPESAIQREAQALDDAIARLEREFETVPAADASAAAVPATLAEPEPEPFADNPAPPQPEAVEERTSPDEFGEAAAGPARETLRPAAPKPATKEGGGLLRLAIILGSLVVVLAMVGFAAWKLRDRPEDLARMKPTPEAAGQQSAGKIDERVGAAANGQATPPPPPGAAGPASPALAVSYRAAVLVQAPSEPGGVKTYLGNVVWRRDSANRGPNQQLASAIRCDIDLPDAHFKMSMVMEKNYEAALSVSHTLTFRFEPAADSPIGNVKAINMPEMRRDEARKGSALQGLPVDVAPNVFLVGLASASEAQNLELLQGLNWFDVPMSLADGRVAKVTFEKGAAGEKIINDVLAEWKVQ